MYKKDFNCYICPTKIYHYISAILVRSWYWSKFFPEVYIEGFTEMNSSVPKDVYEKVLEEAKKNYLADTNDATFDDWESKKSVIDKYACNNFPLKDSPKYIYSCPKELIGYVENILKSCWYYFEIVEETDDTQNCSKSNSKEIDGAHNCSKNNNKEIDDTQDGLKNNSQADANEQVYFKSNMREDALPFVIERAKMQLLSSMHNDCLYISPDEEGNRGGWLTYMMHGVWHTNFYFIATDDDMAMVNKLGYGKFIRKVENATE